MRMGRGWWCDDVVKGRGYGEDAWCEDVEGMSCDLRVW